MPKKRSRPRTPHRPQQQRRRPREASPVSQVVALHEELETWLLDVVPGMAPHEAHGVVEDITLGVVLAVEQVGLRDLGAWTSEQVRGLLQAAQDLDERDPGEQGPGVPGDGVRVVAALSPLFAFLADTGRWAGSEEALLGVREVLDEVSPLAQQVAALTAVIEDPPGGTAVEVAVLRDLPGVRQLVELLRWVGPRRAVTASGGVRRADLAEAADCVGVDVGGRSVRSMWDLARLPQTWQALVSAGLLDVGPTVATRTPDGDRLAARPDDEPDLLVTAVVGLMAMVLTKSESPLGGPPPAAAVVPLLALAVTTGSVPAAVLDEVVTTAPVLPLLQELADLGVVDVEGDLTVTRGLERSVALLALGVLQDMADSSPATAEEGEAVEQPGAVVEQPGAVVPGPGSAQRLRVDLLDADPPVRREVLVDAASTVGELHHVVQSVLGWEDSHLHSFTRGSGAGRSEVDEGAPLARVLRTPRDELLYTYDFGDSWEHLVTLVGVEDAADGGSAGGLPRCTAATGRAPEEDSGGVWGWSAMVAAANDPRSPEHEDVRDWLGLAAGERVDSRAVDLADCDRRLAWLR